MDFDYPISRRGTGCVKWDEEPPCQSGNEPRQEGEDIIPLWVADMDFAVAPAIQEAVKRRAMHPVFGYTHVGDEYYDAVISWFQRRHQWTIHRSEIIYTTGVVPALSATLQALTMHGEKVLMLSPDYNCFFSSIRNSGCEVLEAPLISPQLGGSPNLHRSVDGIFEIDWDDFEQKCSDEKCTVFLLCNPHNPTGRVWSHDELEHMNDICMKHGVKVVSDEIHCELVMPGHTFHPFAAVSEACRQNSVVLNSPSKSFNIAGLQIANIICPNSEWRRRIDRAININEVCDVNPFGPLALIAAYNDSEEWLDQLNQYLWQNYQALCDFAAENLKDWHVCPLEGTYLVWVDITATGMTAQDYADHLMSKARVWVNPGTMYGPQSGEGYIRINIACPHQLLMEGLERIKRAQAHHAPQKQ